LGIWDEAGHVGERGDGQAINQAMGDQDRVIWDSS
jgi:hypothetical protein